MPFPSTIVREGRQGRKNLRETVDGNVCVCAGQRHCRGKEKGISKKKSRSRSDVKEASEDKYCRNSDLIASVLGGAERRVSPGVLEI